MVDYISSNLPVNEEIGKALRREIPMYPEVAIREFVANALIHQDFSIGDSSPMIEVFGNRMNKEDKRRACYQHCCLQYLAGQKMSNESFRRRLGISNEDYSIASRIISDTISAGYIKLDDRESVMLNHHCPLLEYKHTRLQGIIRKAKCTSGLQAYHSL